MSDAQKQAMLDAAAYARQMVDEQNLAREEELVQFFVDEGMTVTEPNIDAFREHVQDFYLSDEEMVATWDMDLYDEVQALAD